jgi:GNAT superfamily N-acetyltransferase
VIRRAALSDKERVIQLLRDSRVGAGFDRADGISGFVFPFDAAHAERLFMMHFTAPAGLCLVLDVDGVAQGVLLAHAFDHPYGPVRVAKENMWWIDPAHRGGSAAIRMLDGLEAWARDQGCAFAGVAGMGSAPDVGVLYQRRGYKPAELHYLKAL